MATFQNGQPPGDVKVSVARLNRSTLLVQLVNATEQIAIVFNRLRLATRGDTMPTPKPDPVPNPNPPPSPLPEPEPPPFPSPPAPPPPPGCMRMANHWLLLLAAVLMHSLVLHQPAQATDTYLPIKKPAKRVQGFVVLVEAGAIVVSVRGSERAFAVAADAKISRNGKPATLSEIRPRDRVRMAVRAGRNRSVATKIKAHAPLRLAYRAPP